MMIGPSEILLMVDFSEDACDQVHHGRNDGLPARGFAEPGRKGITQLGRRVWDETIHRSE